MTYKYFKDRDGDLWRKNGETVYYLGGDTSNRKWVTWNIFADGCYALEFYEAVEITEEELFMELL